MTNKFKVFALMILSALLFAGPAMAKSASKKEAKATSGKAATVSYKARWVQVGGDWKLDWNKGQDKQVCGHANNCNCHGKNSCGEVKNGQVVSYWPNGCDGAEWKIKCEAKLDGAAD